MEYAKDILNDYWTEQELSYIKFGSNKPLFEIQKEYKIHKLQLVQKYTHPAINWYADQLFAKIEGTFDQLK